MLIAMVIAGLFLLVIGVILVVPVRCIVSTADSRYELSQFPIFSVRVAIQEEVRVYLNILGFPIPVRRKMKPRSTEAKQAGTRRKKDGRVVPFSSWVALGKKLLRCFTVKRLQLNVDTGDVVTNAHLVPVFVFASRGNMAYTTNFDGTVSLDLLISLRLYRVAWHIITFYFKNKRLWK
jgi:hypothetical protein